MKTLLKDTMLLGICYIWKEMNWKKFVAAMRESAASIGALMLICATAAIYSWILTKEQVPQQIATMLLQFVDNKYLFMLVVNVFLLIVGMLMEGAAATIILVPLLAPIARSYGIDLVHFGMVVTFNMSIGGVSPPIGTLMFVTCGVTGCKIKDFLKEAIPYFVYMIAGLLLITYVPFTFGFIY